MMTVALKSEGRVEDPKATGKELVRVVCDAVGLPVQGVRSLKLEVTAGEPAVLTVKRFVSQGQMGGMVEKLSEFVLCKPESIQEDE